MSRGSLGLISQRARRTSVFTGRPSHPVPSAGVFGRPCERGKKGRRTLYVTGILPRGQEMALIFDGFLPVTKRKRARAHVSRRRRPLVSSASPRLLPLPRRFCSRGASRRTRDATAECGVFRRLSLRPRPEAENRRGDEKRARRRSPPTALATFNPALNATFRAADSRSR